MTEENKKKLIKVLWNFITSLMTAIGTALGVSSCF